MAPLALGVDLGGSFIKAGLVDANGMLINRCHVPTESLGLRDVAQQIAGIVETFSRECRVAPVGVGLAIPGAIHADRRRVSHSPNFPGWRDVNVVSALAEAGLHHVHIENDANLAAWGEHWVGAGRNRENMAMLTLGTGVGGGLILNNRLWIGPIGMAGELGHITVDAQGPNCGCGSRGCLEQYASGTAVVAGLNASKARSLQPDTPQVKAEQIAAMAREGNAQCQAVFSEAGRALGIAIGILVNVLNLPCVVIGGGMAGAFDLFEPSMRRELLLRGFPVPASTIQVHVASLGTWSGVVGAARLAHERCKT